MGKVLIIAERISACDRIRQQLSAWSDGILTAQTLQEGIQKAKMAQPSLIIWAVGSLKAVRGVASLWLRQPAHDPHQSSPPLLLLSPDSLIQSENLEKLLDPVTGTLSQTRSHTSLTRVPAPEPCQATQATDVNLADFDSPVPPLPPKLSQTLSEIQKLSHALREPLSNMNMAIHILQHVQSAEARDRYLNVLREEYSRELGLLNQLEALQDRLPPLL